MKFGLLYEMQRPFEGTDIDWNTLYNETLEQCELADQVGFDSLWFVEHHFLTGFSGSPCPEVMFGALSQRTKQIRIGFGVSILPHAHPIRIAERVAMVDQLTNGRVEFGTGRSNAYEQVGLGVDPVDDHQFDFVLVEEARHKIDGCALERPDGLDLTGVEAVDGASFGVAQHGGIPPA